MNSRVIQEMQNEQRRNNVPNWVTVAAMCVVLAIILIVLYLQFVRYMLVGESLQLGNNISTALLLSPEISMSIASLI